MRVYTVTIMSTYGEEEHLCGVFSDPESAILFGEKEVKEFAFEYHDEWLYHIIEYQLDVPSVYRMVTAEINDSGDPINISFVE